MGVAPPPGLGARITSLIPRAIGGNLDNKELVPGAKLYLPVFVPGALFPAVTAMACRATARSA